MSPLDGADPREQFAAQVRRHNESRPHSALFCLAPADFCFGRIQDKLKIREVPLKQAGATRINSGNEVSRFTLLKI